MTISRTDLEAIEILNAKRQKNMLLMTNIAQTIYLISVGVLKNSIPITTILQRPRVRTEADSTFLMERCRQVVEAWEDNSKNEEYKAKKIAQILEDTKIDPDFAQTQYKKINAWFSSAVKQCSHMQAIKACDRQTFRNILCEAQNFNDFNSLLKEKTNIAEHFLKTIQTWLKIEYEKFESICSVIPKKPGKSFQMLAQAQKSNSAYQQAVRKLVEKSSPLVEKICTDLCNTNSYADERIAAGISVIPKQIETFDPRKGYEFTTWAYPRVRGEVLNFINRELNQFNVPENIRLETVAENINNLENTQNNAELSPFPTVSIHEPVADGMTLGDFIGHNDDPLSELIQKEKEQKLNAIENVIEQRKLDNIKLMILKTRFGTDNQEGQSLAKTSAIVGRSPLETIFMETKAIFEMSSIILDGMPMTQRIKQAARAITRFAKKEIRENIKIIPRLKFASCEFINAMSIKNLDRDQARLTGEPIIMIDEKKKQVLIFNADLKVVEQLSNLLEQTGQFNEAKLTRGGAYMQYCGKIKYPQMQQFVETVCHKIEPEQHTQPENSSQPQLF